MIVVDTNIIAYLYLPTEYSTQAELLLSKEPDWVTPTLWRSEFRNVLALYLRKSILTFDEAYALQTEAEALLSHKEYDSVSYEILSLVNNSKCSAYDCEFVALAKQLNVNLVTTDRQILKQFSRVAISLKEALR